MPDLDYARPHHDAQQAARRAAWIRFLSWLVCVAAIPATLFCFYAVLFWSWVSATPLTPAQLDRVQYNFYFWLALTVVSIATGIIALAVARWHAPVDEVG